MTKVILFESADLLVYTSDDVTAAPKVYVQNKVSNRHAEIRAEHHDGYFTLDIIAPQ